MPVRGVSFSVRAGEAIGVVGESGSGKSLTALAVSRLIEAPGVVTADRLEFDGRPVDKAPDRDLGTSLAMVFQDPMTSFNPARRVGRQLAEVSEQHHGLSRRAAFARAVDRLAAVRVPAAARRARQYPHEFSGGMRQRAMIGMGLMGEPKLVIADEPTTALDVTVQRQVLRLLARTREAEGAAILLISHDIAVVSQTCERMLVMYAGRVVEDLPTGSAAPAPVHARAAGHDGGPRHRPRRAAGRDPRPPAGAGPGARPAARSPPGARWPRTACRTEDPVLEPAADGHRVACWHPQVSVLSGQSHEEGAA